MNKQAIVEYLRGLADIVEALPKNKNGGDGGFDGKMESMFPGLRGYLTVLATHTAVMSKPTITNVVRMKQRIRSMPLPLIDANDEPIRD